MKVLLLAAGYATRLYPLTENMPKALLPLGKDKCIIDYILEEIDKIPLVTEIVVISNSKFYSQFCEWASSQARHEKAPISVIDDGTDSVDNMRGAIGDIIYAIKTKEINEDFCVMASDNIFTYSILEMYEYFVAMNSDTLVGVYVPEISELRKLGVATIADDGKVLEMQEKADEPKSNWAIYATYFYKKETISLFDDYISEGNSPDAPGNFPKWLCKRKNIYAYRGEGTCIDIGTIENYERIKKEYADR